jgi:hypothetical protein
VAPTAPVVEGDNLLGAELNALPPFRAVFQGNDAAEKTGDLTPPWSANCWDAGARGEVALNDESGARAVALRNLGGGKPSLQFYTWKGVPLEAGKTYAVVCEYATRGGATGALVLRGSGDTSKVAERTVALPDTGGDWRPVKTTVTPSRPYELGLMVQNYAEGTDKPLYVRSLRLTVSPR